jgi:hypothetical protein
MVTSNDICSMVDSGVSKKEEVKDNLPSTHYGLNFTCLNNGDIFLVLQRS